MFLSSFLNYYIKYYIRIIAIIQLKEICGLMNIVLYFKEARAIIYSFTEPPKEIKL